MLVLPSSGRFRPLNLVTHALALLWIVHFMKSTCGVRMEYVRFYHTHGQWNTYICTRIGIHTHAYVGSHTHTHMRQSYTHICWNIYTHLHAYPHLVACRLTPQTSERQNSDHISSIPRFSMPDANWFRISRPLAHHLPESSKTLEKQNFKAAGPSSSRIKQNASVQENDKTLEIPE